MSFNYNHCTLVGRLTKDPELFQLSEHKIKTIITVAVDRPYRKEDGSSDTDFIPVCLWGPTADRSKKLLSKGSPVLVYGSIHVRSYEKEGITVWRTEVVADNFQLLDKLPKRHVPDAEVESVGQDL